ncbi:Nitrate regulatory gene2 protein, partial [Bienertia sinuspersici]
MGQNSYGLGSNTSSPDSREVREREGIPELEEETESEVSKEPYYYDKKKVSGEFSFPKTKSKTVQFDDGIGRNMKSNANFDEGSSKGVRPRVPMQHPHREEVPHPKPPVEVEREVETVEVRDVTERSSISSPETEIESSMSSVEDLSVKKKGVSFDMDGSGHGGGVTSRDVGSSKPSGSTTLSAHGTRDLKEVVREIKDEFEAATDYGNEVSVLLEVGKEPYKSRSTFLKVILARICSTSLSSSYSPSSPSGGSPGNGENILDSRSLASTLEKLYVWEKKLYKEVKDEEKLRVMYEKQCKKLKTLDDNGAVTSKIEATQLSIRKLLTRINVSVRAVDSVSRRIHQLRDEELQPRMKELIYGLRKMWKLMLKCHQKQFQAILESKTRALKANTGLRRDSSVRATIQLEAELLKWCHRFNNWVEMQQSYAETLNGWLRKCIDYQPEETPDGVMPFSPARIGAPPVFVICHDWKQAMERVSGSEVKTAMNDFATSLHQLWERQDEEQLRRDFEKQIRGIRMNRQRKGHEHDDALSDKNSLSMVTSESGISPLDDLKVDLDSMKQRVREERADHKKAVKLVHDAVSRTIQAGLIPIFESLESFTSEASKAFDDVSLGGSEMSNVDISMEGME